MSNVFHSNIFTVTPNLRGEWDVFEGEKQVGHHANAKQAVSQARSLAEAAGGELVIYDRRGKIIERTSFGFAEATDAIDAATENHVPSKDPVTYHDRDHGMNRAGPQRPVTSKRRNIIRSHASGRRH